MYLFCNHPFPYPLVEIKSEMDKETSTETGVYGEPVDGDTPKHEDDSAGSTESTRRTSPWQGDSQGDSELPGEFCTIPATPTNATFCSDT